MNLFAGVLRLMNDRIFAQFGQFSLPLPAKLADHQQVRAYLGKPVVFGLRPTDIDDQPEARAKRPEWVITLPVVQTELLGAEMNVYLKERDIKFTAVVENQSKAEEGRPLDICLHMERLHIFDAETERSIF